ncbi:hypothetical protein [Candidatus Magnetominusculus xianensis]|uniref:Uncharacterized protein n=1 Tax=Candidatus Magnetominusculus xianensis TaxID=1748249 RepID=A0ABR5SKG7_9BACT|nr:hypothetical protein [Candidatus Magnetominusculus xianensis]KWT92720.1 hypothetical protein ASN18_0551 [Candidatus Magnetominusculus xianensis]MBF0403729.1 hypothetical protein [Nitrospirota bacterium]
MEKPSALTGLSIEEVKSRYEMGLIIINEVVGVGIGEEKGIPVIKVYVIEKTKSVMEKLPLQIEGYRVVIEVTGEVHAF